MFKIGDFSRLSRVSVRALRFYDRKGLLKPNRVDPDTGYRYYSAAQLSRLNQIVAFKDLGFSLEQIAELLKDEVSADLIRGMLCLKQAEVRQVIDREKSRLRRIEARLQQIEDPDSVSQHSPILKQVEGQIVAAIRDRLPKCSDIQFLHAELESSLRDREASMIGVPQTIWHDSEYRTDCVDAEAVVPVSQFVPGDGKIESYLLSAVQQMACIIHDSRYDTLVRTYNVLLQWIEMNGLQVKGPNREIYLQPQLADFDFEGDRDRVVVEIQFPVCSL